MNLYIPPSTLIKHYSYPRDGEEPYLTRLGRHEEEHTYQYQYASPLYGLLYLLSGPGSGSNYFERKADEYGAIKNKQNWRAR